MDARRLLHWVDLDDARRQSARRLLPGWGWSVVAGLLLAAEIARESHALGADLAGDSTPRGASTLLLAAITASHVVVLFGAPFRMFWRRDSAFLGRSAIPGSALFTVALVRSVRATVKVALPCAAACAALLLGPAGSVELALRHLVIVALAALSAGVLGPSVALAAGAVVASSKAQSALSGMTGEFRAPTTTWLGTFPGVAGAGLGLLVIALAGWTRGGDTSPAGPPEVLIALAVVLPVACLVWALARADAVMLAATREVAALDQERLAHIDRTQPSPADRVGALLLRDAGARHVLYKDARVGRRRFPIPYFLGVAGLVTQWILAAVNPADGVVWAATIAGGLGVYAVVMARRSTIPPIEYPRYLVTLPVAPRAVTAAKRMQVYLWVAVYMVLGAAPVIARASDRAGAALILGVIAVATLLAGARVARFSDRADP